MQKVKKVMKSNQKYPLSKLVLLDEFTLGGKEEGKQGQEVMIQKRKRLL